jgi:2-keto-3-deoxy-L-rhamnonate aldolase RhmA
MTSRPSLHERLSRQRALVGLLQTHPNPILAEMAGMCGYDFVMLDGEHGVFSDMDFVQALQALDATGTSGIVRLPGHDSRAVGRYLDMGARGIVAPGISTGEQARALVRAMDYPPTGTRGCGASAHRVTRYGTDMQAHWQAPRGGACLLVVIESRLGVENVDDILAVDGVYGALIGTSDLTADLGCARDFSHPAYAHAVSRIEHAAATRGKVLGAAPHPGYPLEKLIANGYRLLIAGADMPLIREALSAQVARARSCLQPG